MPGYFTVQDSPGLDLYGFLKRFTDGKFWNEADKTLETPYVKADHGFVINESAIAGIYEVTLSAGSDALDGAFQFVVLNDADDAPRPGGVMHVRFERGEEVTAPQLLRKLEYLEGAPPAEVHGTQAGLIAQTRNVGTDANELVVNTAAGDEWYRLPLTRATGNPKPVVGISPPV